MSGGHQPSFFDSHTCPQGQILPEWIDVTPRATTSHDVLDQRLEEGAVLQVHLELTEARLTGFSALTEGTAQALGSEYSGPGSDYVQKTSSPCDAGLPCIAHCPRPDNMVLHPPPIARPTPGPLPAARHPYALLSTTPAMRPTHRNLVVWPSIPGSGRAGGLCLASRVRW